MKNKTYLWASLIITMVLLVTFLHYGTHTHHTPLHALYRKLYYLPILMSAFHFGFKGALICAFSCALLYFPHLHMDWGADYLVKNADRSLEVLLYIVIAAITGAYSSYQKKLIHQLQQSHQSLKQQTENLLSVQKTLRKHEKLHAIGLLGAGISHEIRNPLASLKGILEILLSEQQNNDLAQKKELGQIALQEVSRIQDILTRFLSLSKEEKIENPQVDLKKVCLDLVELTKAEVKKSKLESNLELCDQDCIYQGPSGPIQQVLLNLLLNAISMAQHKISIQLKSEPDGFSILVSDDGMGVKEGMEESIFNFFYTTKQEGSGLGLAISSELMHQIGGQVKVLQNCQPTIFQMSFPPKILLNDLGKHKITLKDDEL
ncbi:ATP-binding protein [bacterium]|nr:ATP-binding protein [bacterium]